MIHIINIGGIYLIRLGSFQSNGISCEKCVDIVFYFILEGTKKHCFVFLDFRSPETMLTLLLPISQCCQ